MRSATIGRLSLIFTLAIAATLAAVYHGQLDVAHIVEWIDNKGLVGALSFILLFAVSTILIIPGLLLTFAGGVLFGPILGTLLNLFGATIGAGVAFLIARYVAGDWVIEKSHDRIKQLISGVETEGWRFVAFVRLVPIIPFFLMNYALGVTRIGFTSYLITTFVTLIPSVSAITYLGYAGREAINEAEALAQKLIIAGGLITISVFLPYFFKRFSRKPYSGAP